jgi:AcrR family transcriptional regulator
MASSAVYRYFPSRDSLLTALIIDAFDAVGAVAETAAGGRRTGFVGRWVAVASAIRDWALAHPHDYALVYGSPVPGYRAPQDTIVSALRVSMVGLTIVADGVAAGEIDPAGDRAIPRAVHTDLARLRDEAAAGLCDEVLARCLLAWTALFGSISYELFGHFEGVVEHRHEFFAHQMRRAAEFVAGTRGA